MEEHHGHGQVKEKVNHRGKKKVKFPGEGDMIKIFKRKNRTSKIIKRGPRSELQISMTSITVSFPSVWIPIPHSYQTLAQLLVYYIY